MRNPRGAAGSLFALLLLTASSCQHVGPKAWLRYEPTGAHDWEATGEGRLAATLHGCRVEIDLHQTQTRVELIAANDTGKDLEFRVGPDATRDPHTAIGEVQRRPLDNKPGEEVLDYVPYVPMQRLEVRHGWRAIFALDSPLGRDPVLGQYFVLVVEVRDPTGAMVRKLLPLTATNAPLTRSPGR
ncbi:MAG: hypothetical protein IPK26_21690 [Planctomycetes bacterium]|nr:hypothetical protein [Planctomycetota bacterium]